MGEAGVPGQPEITAWEAREWRRQQRARYLSLHSAPTSTLSSNPASRAPSLPSGYLAAPTTGFLVFTSLSG